MESSRYTDVTLDIFETLWQPGLPPHRRRPAGGSAPDRAGRSSGSSRSARASGSSRAPTASRESVAYQSKADVDAAYVRLIELLLVGGQLSGHRHPRSGDDRPRASSSPRSTASAADRFEFQMLYGIRRDLQAALVGEGYRVRVYSPVRPPVVSVLHAPSRRTSRQCRVRAAQHPPRARTARRKIGRPSNVGSAPTRLVSVLAEISTISTLCPLTYRRVASSARLVNSAEERKRESTVSCGHPSARGTESGRRPSWSRLVPHREPYGVGLKPGTPRIGRTMTWPRGC